MAHVLDHGWLSGQRRPRRVNRYSKWRYIIGVHVILSATLVVVSDNILSHVIVHVVAKLVRWSTASGVSDDDNH